MLYVTCALVNATTNDYQSQQSSEEDLTHELAMWHTRHTIAVPVLVRAALIGGQVNHAEVQHVQRLHYHTLQVCKFSSGVMVIRDTTEQHSLRTSTWHDIFQKKLKKNACTRIPLPAGGCRTWRWPSCG